MAKKKRDANYEVLRILLMVMVLIMHYLSHTGVLIEGGTPSLFGDGETGARIVRAGGTLLESFCIVAVNTWVLMSGFFLSKSAFRLKRLIGLVLTVWFYTIGISAVMQMVGTYEVIPGDRIFRSVQYLFPVASEHYWFFTAYVWMYLLSPVLNAGIDHMPRGHMKAVIIGLLLWFCLLKSVVPVNFVTDDFGYGLKWFICLYLIGAYIRRYDVRIVNKKTGSLLLYAGSALVIFAAVLLLHEINARTGRLNYYLNVTWHYNFLPVLTGALGLLSFTRMSAWKEGLVAKCARGISPYVLGVYLLHGHLEIRDRWVIWMESLFGTVPVARPAGFLLHLALSVAVMFVAGILVDWVRANIFRFVQRVLKNTAPMRYLDALDERLAKVEN